MLSLSNPETFRSLVKHGANPDLTNNSLDTPLIRAVNNNSVEIVRTLIEYNANVNGKDATNHTPLFYAKRRADNIASSHTQSNYGSSTVIYNGRVISTEAAPSPPAYIPAESAPMAEGYGYRNFRARLPSAYRSPVPPSNMKSAVTQHNPIVDMLTKAGGHI